MGFRTPCLFLGNMPYSCGGCIRNFLKERVMPDYIVCQKKRNNPRMDVRICERRCPDKGDCKEYLAYNRAALQAASPSPQAEAPALELEAA